MGGFSDFYFNEEFENDGETCSLQSCCFNLFSSRCPLVIMNLSSGSAAIDLLTNSSPGMREQSDATILQSANLGTVLRCSLRT